MRVTLAGFVWLLSGMFCNAASQDFKYISQTQLSDAEFVANWLKVNKSGLDLKGATAAFELGQKYKRNKQWSAAAKGFGESAIRYPSPQTLTQYAEVKSLSLGAVRAREKVVDQYRLSDMTSLLRLYQSAVAANSVLASLSVKEKNQLQANVDCLGAFVAAPDKPHKHCAPLKSYMAFR
jgi:hypothetical protein